MALQLPDIRQAVRSNLDDMQYDSSKIDAAINWFQYELFNNTRTGLMETSVTLNPTAGATSVPFPDDFQVMLNLTVTSPSIYSIWNYRMPQQTFDRDFPGYGSYAARDLYETTVYGRTLRFSAPLRTNTTLVMDYVRKPAKATESSPVLEVPDQYEELVVLGAQARVMEVNEDFAEAAQIRDNLDPLMTVFIRNEGRGGAIAGPRLMRSNRRRQGANFGDPYGAY